MRSKYRAYPKPGWIIKTLASLVLLALSILLLGGIVSMCSGCTSLHYKTTTKDGRVIEASSYGFLHERTIKGFEYNDEKGFLKVTAADANPDKESITALCNTINALVGAAVK